MGGIGIKVKFTTPILWMSLSLILLNGCQKYTPLPKSPSNITIIKYNGYYKNIETIILIGKEKNKLLSVLNNAGKHIVPKDAKFNCANYSKDTTVYRDIIVHYDNKPHLDRLFEMNTLGCTFLNDIKDGINLNPKPLPNLEKYFK